MRSTLRGEKKLWIEAAALDKPRPPLAKTNPTGGQQDCYNWVDRWRNDVSDVAETSNLLKRYNWWWKVSTRLRYPNEGAIVSIKVSGRAMTEKTTSLVKCESWSCVFFDHNRTVHYTFSLLARTFNKEAYQRI